jgi:hypothetical protein
MAATEVLTDLGPRLEAAARACDDRSTALAAEHEIRNRLIVEAIDQGMTQTSVARFAHLTPARVTAILANSQPTAQLPQMA